MVKAKIALSSQSVSQGCQCNPQPFLLMHWVGAVPDLESPVTRHIGIIFCLAQRQDQG